MNAPNVDPRELEKFNALAADWWDPEGASKPLHQMNPLRMAYIAERAPLAGSKVVDIGCGGGLLTEALAVRGARVTGIDLGEKPLAVAHEHALEGGLDIGYELVSAENFAAAHEGEFDVVTCLEMLEHVPEPANIVAAARRLLKPGGAAFFSTINRNPKAYLLAVLGAEYILGLLPRGTHDYDKFIKPSELDAWSRQSGLELKDISGVHYNPLTGDFSLGANADVNYLAYFRAGDARRE